MDYLYNKFIFYFVIIVEFYKQKVNPLLQTKNDYV